MRGSTYIRKWNGKDEVRLKLCKPTRGLGGGVRDLVDNKCRVNVEDGRHHGQRAACEISRVQIENGTVRVLPPLPYSEETRLLKE